MQLRKEEEIDMPIPEAIARTLSQAEDAILLDRTLLQKQLKSLGFVTTPRTHTDSRAPLLNQLVVSVTKEEIEGAFSNPRMCFLVKFLNLYTPPKWKLNLMSEFDKNPWICHTREILSVYFSIYKP